MTFRTVEGAGLAVEDVQPNPRALGEPAARLGET